MAAKRRCDEISLFALAIPLLSFACTSLLVSNCLGQAKPEIEGRWRKIEPKPSGPISIAFFTFRDNEMSGGIMSSSYVIDETASPKEINIGTIGSFFGYPIPSAEMGIYEIRNGRLTILTSDVGEDRPTDFGDRTDGKVSRSVYENVTEELDDDAALILGKWEVSKNENFPYKSIESIDVTQPEPFVNTIRGTVVGWQSARRGQAKQVTSIELQLDSNKNPKQLTGSFDMKKKRSSTQFRSTTIRFTGTYELEPGGKLLKMVLVRTNLQPSWQQPVPPPRCFLELKRQAKPGPP